MHHVAKVSWSVQRNFSAMFGEKQPKKEEGIVKFQYSGLKRIFISIFCPFKQLDVNKVFDVVKKLAII